MHTVAVLALDGVLAFDLSTPIEVFGRARLPGGRAAYRVRICAPADQVDAGAFSIRAPRGLDALAEAEVSWHAATPKWTSTPTCSSSTTGSC